LSEELIKQLLGAGVHFGHQAKRWNPKMKKFIYTQKNGIYIIDLEGTVQCLQEARNFLIEITSKGASILFVGTKRQAQEIIREEAARAGMYWISERWPGGLLTNFSTIKKSINRLKEIGRMQQEGIYERLTKKEVAALEKERQRLEKYFSGIVNMEQLPSCLFVVDIKKEDTAVREANRLNIPVVGLIDTNSDPDFIKYPIPGNDDAIKSIRLITSLIAEAIIEGRKKFLAYLSTQTPQLEKEQALEQNQGSCETEAVITSEEDTQIKEVEETVEQTVEDKQEEPVPQKSKRLRQSSAKTKKK
jgi:small subunit ribosomal protein S2